MPTLLDDAQLLDRLIAFDSVSRNSTGPIIGFLCDYLDRPGVTVWRHPSPDGEKANLVVRVGPEPGPDRERGLTLCGHLDVVPADEPGWTSDPFRLTRRGDRFVGRGTADMKGFLALAANRLAGLDPDRLRAPLALVFTYDEELGTLGARHFVETWDGMARLPRRTLVGEPTSLRAVRMHKGHLKLRLAVRGAGAHTGYPHLGHSAVEPAARAIVALAGLRETLERERPFHAEQFPEVPYVALTVAQVSGGTAINVVPEACEVLIGVRVLPGMAGDDLTERIAETVAPVLAGEDYTLEVTGDSPPFLLDDAHPFHRELADTLRQTGSHSVSFATDAGWLQAAGFDCVIMGPGTIEVAHKPDESLPVDEFVRAGHLLDDLLARYCLEDG